MQRKLRNLCGKFCAFRPKLKKILRFFDQNLSQKLTLNFLLIFLGVLPLLRKYMPLEDNTGFLQQFFRFRGRDTFRRPPPLPPDGTEKYTQFFTLFGGDCGFCTIFKRISNYWKAFLKFSKFASAGAVKKYL